MLQMLADILFLFLNKQNIYNNKHNRDKSNAFVIDLIRKTHTHTYIHTYTQNTDSNT